MATPKNPNQFDPTRFDYNLQYQDGLYPPNLNYIRNGFTNYEGFTAERINRGERAPMITGIPGFTAEEFNVWLEGYLEFHLNRIRNDRRDLIEAHKLIAENPVYAKILDLHKRGLL